MGFFDDFTEDDFLTPRDPSLSSGGGGGGVKPEMDAYDLWERDRYSYQADTGLGTDIGRSFMRGVTGTIGLGGSALERAGVSNLIDDWAEDRLENHYRPDRAEFYDENNFAHKAVTGVAEMLPTTLAIMGVAAGTAATGGALGIAGGSLMGGAAALSVVGAGVDQQTQDELRRTNPEMSDEEIKKIGFKMGAAEMVSEASTIVIPFGLGKLAKMGGGQLVTKTIGDSIKQMSKAKIAAGFSGGVAGDIASEAGNSYYQAETMNKARGAVEGDNDWIDPNGAALEVIGPSALLGTIFGTWSMAPSVKMRSKQKTPAEQEDMLKRLNDQDPNVRTQAVAEMAFASSGKIDIETATQFAEAGNYAVATGVGINPDLSYSQFYDNMDKVQKASGVAKRATGKQVGLAPDLSNAEAFVDEQIAGLLGPLESGGEGTSALLRGKTPESTALTTTQGTALVPAAQTPESTALTTTQGTALVPAAQTPESTALTTTQGTALVPRQEPGLPATQAPAVPGVAEGLTDPAMEVPEAVVQENLQKATGLEAAEVADQTNRLAAGVAESGDTVTLATVQQANIEALHQERAATTSVQERVKKSKEIAKAEKDLEVLNETEAETQAAQAIETAELDQKKEPTTPVDKARADMKTAIEQRDAIEKLQPREEGVLHPALDAANAKVDAAGAKLGEVLKTGTESVRGKTGSVGTQARGKAQKTPQQPSAAPNAPMKDAPLVPLDKFEKVLGEKSSYRLQSGTTLAKDPEAPKSAQWVVKSADGGIIATYGSMKAAKAAHETAPVAQGPAPKAAPVVTRRRVKGSATEKMRRIPTAQEKASDAQVAQELEGQELVPQPYESDQTNKAGAQAPENIGATPGPGAETQSREAFQEPIPKDQLTPRLQAFLSGSPAALKKEVLKRYAARQAGTEQGPTSRAAIYQEMVASVKEEALLSGYAGVLDEVAGTGTQFYKDAVSGDKTKAQTEAQRSKKKVADAFAKEAEELRKKNPGMIGSDQKALKTTRRRKAALTAEQEEVKSLANESRVEDLQEREAAGETLTPAETRFLNLANEAAGDAELSADQLEELTTLGDTSIPVDMTGVENGLDLLNAVEAQEGDSTLGALARMIQKIADPTWLYEMDVLGTSGKANAAYDPNTQMLKSGEGGWNTGNAIHELLHAITVNQLDQMRGTPEGARVDKELQRIQLALEDYMIAEGIISEAALDEYMELSYQGQKDFMEKLPARTRALLYAVGNRYEMITMGLSSSAVQDALRAIELPASKQTSWMKTAWDYVTSVIGKALGVPTEYYSALQSLIETTTLIAETQMGENYALNKAALQEELSGNQYQPEDSMVDESVDDMLERIAQEQGILGSLEPGTAKAPRTKEQIKAYAEEQRVAEEISMRKRTADAGSRVMGVVDQYIQPVADVIGKIPVIGEKVQGMLRTMEAKIQTYDAQYAQAVKPFMDAVLGTATLRGLGPRRGGLSPQDQETLAYYWNNYADPDHKELLTEFLESKGMTEAFAQVEEVLADIHDRYDEIGMNPYEVEKDYLPRRVKDVRELMAWIDGHPEDGGPFSEILRDPNLTESEQAQAIKALTDTISNGRLPSSALKMPSSVRERTIKSVSRTMTNKFYENPADVLGAHIREANEAIETRAFIGKEKRVQVAAKISSIHGQVLKAREAGNKVLEKKFQDREDLLQQEYDGFEKDGVLNDDVIQASLAGVLTAQEQGSLTPSQQEALLHSIRARVNQAGMHGGLAKMRDIGLMASLGDVMSTITQFADPALAMGQFGIRNTLASFTGARPVKASELDLQGAMQEYQTGGFSKAVGYVLRATGLKGVDQYFKGVSLTAGIRQGAGQSLSEFKDQWDVVFGDTGTTALHQELKDALAGGEVTDNVRTYAFHQVSKINPVSMSEMPQRYLTAGNGRIFYTLKSYNIKAFGVLRNEALSKMMVPGTRQEGFKNLVRVGGLLIVAGMGTDALKDFLLGRDADMDDRAWENLLNIFLLSDYTLEQGKRVGLGKALITGTLIPPGISAFDPLMKDTFNLVTKPEGEKTFDSLKKMPGLGRLAYEWLGAGREKSLDREKADIYKDIRETVSGAGSYSAARVKVNEFNRKARKAGVAPITNRQIRRVKSAERKKARES